MISTVDLKIEQYKQIYEQLKEKLRWKVGDKRTLMIVASMYAVNEKPFCLSQFLELSEYVKKQVGFFSPLKSSSRFTMAAMLDVRFEQPTEACQELLRLYNTLVAGGFARGIFTYIAAATMLSQRSNYDETIARSLHVYKEMKARHMFLTSHSDYPLAVLLAKTEGNVEDIVQRMEGFYEKLSEKGFKKGNDLQFLSHVLALYQEAGIDVVVNRCTDVFQELKQSGYRVKRMHYSSIGLLTMLGDEKQVVEDAILAANSLDEEGLFKPYSSLNFILGTNLLVSGKVANPRLLETGMYTAIEAIIQAQQAAMISAVTVASVSASAGGGEGS